MVLVVNTTSKGHNEKMISVVIVMPDGCKLIQSAPLLPFEEKIMYFSIKI